MSNYQSAWDRRIVNCLNGIGGRAWSLIIQKLQGHDFGIPGHPPKHNNPIMMVTWGGRKQRRRHNDKEDDDDSTAESDDDTSSCSSVASDDDSFVADDLEDYLTPIVAKPEIDTPQPQLPMLRRGTRIRKPNPRYASTYTSTVCWETLCEDKELQEACARTRSCRNPVQQKHTQHQCHPPRTPCLGNPLPRHYEKS